MLAFLHETHFTQVLRLELELGGRTQNSHYAKIYQQVLSGGVKRRNQNQKFSFPFFAGSPPPPPRKKEFKEKIWGFVDATGGGGLWPPTVWWSGGWAVTEFVSERTITFHITRYSVRATSFVLKIGASLVQ